MLVALFLCYNLDCIEKSMLGNIHLEIKTLVYGRWEGKYT